MDTGASGLFAARDPPDLRPPSTEWRDDARPATAFPDMLQHARTAAAALAAAPVRLRAAIDGRLRPRLGPSPPEPDWMAIAPPPPAARADPPSGESCHCCGRG
jgi:hypothetical protein